MRDPIPLGISRGFDLSASRSRLSDILIADSSRRPSALPREASAPSSVETVRGAALERGLQRVPGERRALDAHRELAHAREHRELAERRPPGAAPSVSPVTRSWKRSKSASRLRAGLALHALGHQRRRGGRDRAAAALEADVLDARRRRARGRRSPGRRRAGCSPRRVRSAPVELAEVPRPLAVVEDHLLVEVAQVAASREHLPDLAEAARPARRPRRACCRGRSEARAVAGRRSAPSPAARSGGRCGWRRPRGRGSCRRRAGGRPRARTRAPPPSRARCR